MLEYATPIFVVLAFAAVILMQKLESNVERLGGKVPICVRYFVWMYAIMFMLLARTLVSMVRDVMIPSGWLDVETVSSTVRIKMISEDPENGTQTLEAWQREADLTRWGTLQFLSMLSPIWVCGTFVIATVHSALHAANMEKRLRSGDRQGASYHNKTIRILALPLVYGLMSLQGVIRMWGVTINRVDGTFDNWPHRKSYLLDMYEEAIMVADAYESYALFSFAVLAMAVLSQQVDAEAEAAGLASPHESLVDKHMHFDKVSQALKNLTRKMKGITVLGVKLFCITCAGQAAYRMMCTISAYYRIQKSVFGSYFGSGREGLLQTSSVKAKTEYFFLGAGFVASFAAIGNLVEVERGFHDSELHSFGPFLKFWSTKCLVTIAYLQSTLKYLPPFSGWPTVHFNLFYASGLCLECFLISVLHVFAWSPWEEWYFVVEDSCGDSERSSEE